jgi:hypothetical protein
MQTSVWDVMDGTTGIIIPHLTPSLRKERMEGSSYRRIVVIGTTGSGKSTMAEHIAARLGLPFVELDALHWQPDWRPASLEEMRARV